MTQLKGVINMASKDLACEVTSVISDLYKYLRDLVGIRLVDKLKNKFKILILIVLWGWHRRAWLMR